MTVLGRAFVAVVPPPEVLDALEAHLATLGEESGLRRMRREQLHFTLQFLGRVEDAETLAERLERAVGANATFDARLAGVGAFPSARRARVVWVGVDLGAGAFGALAVAVHRATAQLGYEAEDRAYTPHMTVARSPRPRPVHAVLEAIGTEAIDPAWKVDEVVFFESDTRPDGAVHTARGRFPLGGR